MKPTKNQLIKHLDTLSSNKLGNDYAYIMSSDLDRSLWWANDKEYRPIIQDRLATEILMPRNSKYLDTYLKEIGYKSSKIKDESLAKVQRIVKTLKAQNDFITQKTRTGIEKGAKVKYVHIYTKKRYVSNSNQFALPTFSDADGHGFLFPLPINQSSIKNQSGMKKPTTKKAAAKKPTAKQLAARKRFTAMAKSGELAKRRATAAKNKPSLKKPASKGLTTLCAKTVGVTGRRKKDGTQKKGYVASKGGTLKKKAPAKKKY